MLKKLSKMHEEDAHDNNVIAMETSNQIYTGAQMRAAENAAKAHISETADCNDNARQNGDHVNPFGAMASVAGVRSGPWTGWIGPAPV